MERVKFGGNFEGNFGQFESQITWKPLEFDIIFDFCNNICLLDVSTWVIVLFCSQSLQLQPRLVYSTSVTQYN